MSVGSYNDPVLRELIHIFKYKSVKELSIPLGVLIKRLIKIKAKNIFNRLDKKMTIIVPIPLHPRRLRERGFNQSELLAEKLSEHTNLPIAKNIVIRNPNFSEGKNVILVDDVAATCATLEECALALKQSGAKKIWGFVIAKG